MKKINNLFIQLLAVSLVFVSCKKDDESPVPAAIVQTPTPVPTQETNTNPALIMTLPAQNLSLGVGNYVKIEGIATDVEGLKAIVCIGVVTGAYYNSSFTDTILISGTNTFFSDSVLIPTNTTPGNLNFEFFAIDLQDSVSNSITRAATTRDVINPTKYYNNYNVNELDSIIVTVYRNSFNIVDSLNVFNQTTGQMIGSLKDNIGFKLFVYTVVDGVNYLTTSLLYSNLITNNSTSYHIRIPLKNSTPGFIYTNFTIGLDELDDISIGGGKTNHFFSFTIN